MDQGRLLHVEDSADDAELVRLELKRRGRDFRVRRVDEEPAYLEAISDGLPDAILCDYDMPRFSAERALALLREKNLDIPFIVVSNHIGETAAVVAMQHGADDYLSKGDLGRLPKAIDGAVERAHARRERARALEALRASEAMKRGILDSLDSRIVVLDRSGTIVATNRAWDEFDQGCGASERAGVGDNYLEVLRAAAAAGDAFGIPGEEAIREVLERRRPYAALDYPLGVGAGARWHLARVLPLAGGHGAVVAHEDVTDRILAHSALEAAHRRQQALSMRVLTVQEEERRSIARELHDDLGQNLAALKIGLHRLSQGDRDTQVLEECVRTVEATLDRLRDIAQELRPPQLDQLGLVDALGWLAQRQRRASGIDVRCQSAGFETERPPAELEVVCYRIAQEALNNATRHGRPREVVMRLEREGELLKLTIRDDGDGFDEESQRQRAVKTGSLGLIGMEERAALAGGRLRIKSVPGAGTTVSAIFPLPWKSPS